MASVMDELREHQAALEAVAGAARDIQREMPPAVEKLRELNAQIERRRHDVLTAAFAWALFGGVLGGLVASLVPLIVGR